MAARFLRDFEPQHALRILDELAPSQQMRKPIESFDAIPVVSLEDTVEPLVSLVPKVKEMDKYLLGGDFHHEQFLGKAGDKTLFNIDYESVVSCLDSRNGLFIIQTKEVESDYPLLRSSCGKNSTSQQNNTRETSSHSISSDYHSSGPSKGPIPPKSPPGPAHPNMFHPPHAGESLKMIRNLVKCIWQKFLELNLYKKHSSNEHTLEKEFLATRIYVIALIVCVSIITIAVALIVRPVDKIEYKPSHEKFSQLIRKYPNTLRCPCSKSSTNYAKFVTTKVSFHQVCSSEFIQQTWIEKLFTNENISSESIDDARITLSFFWQTIAGLCIASNKSWNDVLANFEGTSFITPTAVAEQVIRTQAENALQNQIDLSKTISTRNLLALQRITRGNQVVSALQTNFYLRYPPARLNLPKSAKMIARTFGNCSCLNIEGCPRSATFNDSYGHLTNVPGMIVDCLIVDGTLASTLECYYNQSCISILHGQLSMNIKPLSNTSNKNFSMYSTVQFIFNKSMIDDTITEIRFDKYFSECNCPFCSYSYSRRFDIFFMFTAVTASIGILPVIIRHIASFIATMILRRKNRILPMENVSAITSMEHNRKQRIQLRIRLLLNKLWQAIVSLNLFEKQTHRTPTNIYREQLLTRFFIFGIVILSIAAGLYTIVIEQNQVITIQDPSLDTYEQLYKDHPTTLYCPCSQISISNEVFLNVTFVLHQVCSSDLVSLEWLHYLISFDPTHLPLDINFKNAEDFRKMGVSYFQLLAAFCSLAEANIADAQHVFINTKFINDRVPSESRFTQQTGAMLTTFIDTTINDFVQTFNWTKLLFLYSPLYNGLNTNVLINKSNDGQVVAEFREYLIVIVASDGSPQLVHHCTCGSEPNFCYAIPVLYMNTSYLDNIYRNLLFKILYLGCSPLSGFLMSRTEWWYDITYMKHIHATYSMTNHTRPPPNIKPLNASISTQFDDPKTEDLLDKMLLEKTINNTDFDRFYNACKPSFCSYTVVQRRHYIVIIFLLISICSGLNKGLQLLVPLIGKIIFICFDWKRNRNTQRGSSSIGVRFRNFPRIIYDKIENFNIYETELNDNTHIRQQQIHTRVYLFLYVILLSIVLFYTILVERRISKTDFPHSIDEYEQLLSLYSDDISCPCTYTSIPYGSFITELQRIPIIIFADIANFITGSPIYGEDYSLWGKSFIESLEQLCSLTKDNVNKNINVFLASTLFTNQLMFESLFNTEMDEILSQFKNKTKTTFAHMLDFIRSAIQGNALLHITTDAWSLVAVKTDDKSDTNFLNVPVTRNNTQENTSCSCVTLRTCRIPRQVKIDGGSIPIDGLVIGCHQLETLLFSSLTCFYFVDCINILRKAFYTKSVMMNQSIGLNAQRTRFSVNDTVENIAYEMFIESWSTNKSYERYFNSCSPSYCIYTYYQKSDALEILTTFLSASGSLSIAVYFIVPYLVKLIKKILICFRTTQQQ
ncbi:unnamed protein product [Adineta steineri]|uniref:Uncharacterized protein n=1 Tax=Adineta steineri TaxID=433720 RepID=A0A815ZXF7_9BILA|nr:unnamed protein product [Adineta steineri]CAF1590515.1 unnamed protein product [Adineta steineri]